MTTSKEESIRFILDNFRAGKFSRRIIIKLSQKKYGISERTFDRHWELAQKQWKEACDKLSSEKHSMYVQAEKEAVKLDIIDKNERMQIASIIALGQIYRNISGQIFIPSDSDRLKALDYLSKIAGDYNDVSDKASGVVINLDLSKFDLKSDKL